MRYLSVILFFSLNMLSFGQQREIIYNNSEKSPKWVQLMYSDNPDPEMISNAYKLYYKTAKFKKNKHTQYYKRWLRSFSRNNPINDRNYSSKSQELRTAKSPLSQWNCIGPFDFDIDAQSRSYAPGAAHIYTIEQSLSNPQVMYAGAATAGLWKSINGGDNWVLTTKYENLNSIFAIEIDHTNPDIVYFESGGKVYKTIDGANNWSIIGDNSFNSSSHQVQDIVMSPINNQVLFLSSNHGFYKTIDGGSTWTAIMTGAFQEIELNPNDPTMVYTIKQVNNKTEFYKSLDDGASFTIKPNGWPNPVSPDEQKRVEMAVTPANSNYIYANATGKANGGSGTYGIYFSDDMGESWTFRCCGSQPAGIPSISNQNLMAWSKNGTEDGGQYYYDVAFAVDPIDPNKLHLGGVNHWFSTDGGYSFTCPSSWSEPHLQSYVHADIHDIRFFGSDLWIAGDGGIFKSQNGGTNFEKSMLGIAGTDFWGFGVSKQSEVMLGGAYHNGTLLKDNNTYINDWICTGGGDGMRGFVNPGNSRIVYDDWEGRILSGDRDIAIQSFQFDSLPNASYIIGESSNMAFYPYNYNTLIVGRGPNLLKTSNNGQSFQLIHNFEKKVTKIELAPTNTDVIYAATYKNWWGSKQIWKSVNEGDDWEEITPPSSLYTGAEWVPWDLTVSSNNSDIIWAAKTSQYSDSPNLNNKMIFKSADGGQTWSNYTTSTLNNEYITNIIHQHGTDGGVYLGTRRAVYYRNNSMSDWQLFNNGLPISTTSVKLNISYERSKLINGTNRSVYEVDLYENSLPQAQISSDIQHTSCSDSIVQFVDLSVLSSNNPTWQWNFENGNPSSSTLQNPIVNYSTAGNHDVSLSVTDDFGTSTQNYIQFIEFNNNEINGNFSEDFELGLSENWAIYNSNNSYNWQTTSLANGPLCTNTTCMKLDHYNVSATGDEAELIFSSVDLSNISSAVLAYDYAYAKWGGTNEDGFRIDISTDCGTNWTPLFEAFGDELETVDDQNTEWTPSDCADWSTNNYIDLSMYTNELAKIRFVGINGYGNNFYLDNIYITTNIGVNKLENAQAIRIYPNPSNGKITIANSPEGSNVSILNIEGKTIRTYTINSKENKLDLNLSPGIYFILIESHETIQRQKIVIF